MSPDGSSTKSAWYTKWLPPCRSSPNVSPSRVSSPPRRKFPTSIVLNPTARPDKTTKTSIKIIALAYLRNLLSVQCFRYASFAVLLRFQHPACEPHRFDLGSDLASGARIVDGPQ